MENKDKKIEYQHILSSYINNRNKLYSAIDYTRLLLKEFDFKEYGMEDAFVELPNILPDARELLQSLNTAIKELEFKGAEKFNPADYKLDLVIDAVQSYLVYFEQIKTQFPPLNLETEKTDVNTLN